MDAKILLLMAEENILCDDDNFHYVGSKCSCDDDKLKQMSLATMTLALPLPSVTIMTPTITVSQTTVAPICPKWKQPLCLFYDDELIDTKLSTFQSDGLYHVPTPPNISRLLHIIPPCVLQLYVYLSAGLFFQKIFVLFCVSITFFFWHDGFVFFILLFCFVCSTPNTR